MNSRRYTIAAGTAGILFALLALSRVPYSGEIDQPGWSDTQAIGDFYATATFDGPFAVGMASVILAYSLLVLFIAKVLDVLTDSTGMPRWIGAGVAGLVAIDVTLTIGYVVGIGTARQLASNEIPASDAVIALHAIAFGFYWAELMVFAGWTMIVGATIATSRAFPRWLGIFMLATALLSGTVFFLSDDTWNASGISYLWAVVLGAILIWRRDRYVAEVEAAVV